MVPCQCCLGIPPSGVRVLTAAMDALMQCCQDTHQAAASPLSLGFLAADSALQPPQASELGYWALARHAFECGLRINSRHVLILERLLEVLLRLGDWEAAEQLARRLLQQDPGHPRATSIAGALADGLAR